MQNLHAYTIPFIRQISTELQKKLLAVLSNFPKDHKMHAAKSGKFK